MNAGTLIAFTAGMFLLALSPGPGVLATSGRAVHCGLRQALVLVLGLATRIDQLVGASLIGAGVFVAAKARP